MKALHSSVFRDISKKNVIFLVWKNVTTFTWNKTFLKMNYVFYVEDMQYICLNVLSANANPGTRCIPTKHSTINQFSAFK